MAYIMYGAGSNAKKMIEKLQMFITIEMIVDSDPNKNGKKIGEVPITSTQTLESGKYKDDIIIVSVTNKAIKPQIYRYLESLGFKEGMNLYDGSKMVNIYEAEYGRVSGYVSTNDSIQSIKSFDPKSRLFVLKEEKRIFRGISDDYVQYYSDLLKKLEDANFLGNEVVSTKTVKNNWELPYSLIIEHEYIEPISYCYEWAPKMYCDYVSFMIKFLKKLSKCNLGIVDGHALNTTIYQGKFLFIDFGALVNEQTSPITFIEFLDTHILPLILLKKNRVDTAYMFMKNSHISFSFLDIKGYLSDDEYEKLIFLYNMALFAFDQEKIEKFLDTLSQFISEVNSFNLLTIWEGYQNDEWNWSSNKTQWSIKMKNVIDLIQVVHPESIIDLAGNMGWYGSYLHDEVNRVIVADLDYNCVDYLWKKTQDMKLENVYPIYMSLCTPTLDYYKDYPISSHSGLIPWRLSANKRFKSELALSLAIIHHLVFGQQLTFNEVINQIMLYTGRYLIIEFVDQRDKYIDYFLKEGFEWYTKENFEKELLKKFDILEVRESTPSETRTLYLCQLKNI